MRRSAAYWAGNRYLDPERQPKPTAPCRDLGPAAGARFRRARAALLAIAGAEETVRFMGARWGWAWEYGIGARRLCWLHALAGGLSATFSVSAQEEQRILALPRLAASVREALRDGARTGPVRWCALELADARAVSALVALMRRKAAWVAEEGGLGLRRSAAG